MIDHQPASGFPFCKLPVGKIISFFHFTRDAPLAYSLSPLHNYRFFRSLAFLSCKKSFSFFLHLFLPLSPCFFRQIKSFYNIFPSEPFKTQRFPLFWILFSLFLSFDGEEECNGTSCLGNDEFST
jgi:hypothetical protein